MKIDINDFRRCAIPDKPGRKVVTVNLRPDNFLKLKNLDVFLSKIVTAFVESTDQKTLEKNFPTDKVLKENFGRIVSSVSLRIELYEKIKNVNKTALVNSLIESL